jgi:peptidoglycan/LPS O-acetylase OafA/YrhL
MKIKYRPEVDGLRALCVIPVILYHANITLNDKRLFQGGFIGVDIFFVISGYLITSLILKEILQFKTFSFQNFYERRLRRIIPALLFVTIISYFLGYLILLPISFIDFSKSVLSALFFISNFFFHYTGRGYEAESQLLVPLLHTWSLSIEEQFYILFPIFLIILIKFFKNYVLRILILSFFVSLLVAEYLSKFHNSFNFYMLPTRSFELLAGSLLSCVELQIKKKNINIKYNTLLTNILSALGLIFIFCSFYFFNLDKISHPSFITLIPIVGAIFIIFFTKKEIGGVLIKNLLSNKILVFFGIISYSLYLWHYPIFAYLRYIDVFENSIKIKLLSILLIFILSVISYYYIEKPFRDKNIIPSKIFFLIISIIILVLVCLSIFVIKKEGLKDRFPKIINEKLSEDYDKINYNRLGKKGNVLVIGDSHSYALNYHLNEELKKESFNFYHKKTDFFLMNFNKIDRKSGNIDNEFLENNKNIYKFLNENENLIVIWKQRWTVKLLETYFDNEEGSKEFEKFAVEGIWHSYLEPKNVRTSSLKERQDHILRNIIITINDIIKKGHILILVYPNPEMGFNVPRLMGTKISYNHFLNNKEDIPILSTSYNVFKKRNKMILDLFDGIETPGLYKVNTHKFFCNTLILNRCIANNKQHLFYYDDDHLSLEGSKYPVKDIMKIIDKIKLEKKLIN